MAGDASWASVVLLLHGNGTNGGVSFLDASLSAKTVTPAGNAQTSTAQYKFNGSSILMDGSGDHLSVPDSADWDFGTGDFTIETFARFSAHTTVQTLLGNYLNASTGWSLQRRSDSNALVFGNGDTQLISRAWTPVDGTWYHLAACRAGTNLRLFVEGTQQGAAVTDSTDISGSTNALLVGSLFLGGYLQDYAGNLAEIRITKGVARYTGNFTPPAAPFAEGVGQVSGVTKDDTDTPASRVVRAYRRDTGALIANVTSDGVTGAYTFYTQTLDELHVITLDDAAGTLYNDRIERVIPA